jgi:hypothetical protein
LETIKIWVRPAILAGLWIAAASFTLAELTTVLPSLRAAPAEAGRYRVVTSGADRLRARSPGRKPAP